jgi:hypothetical protein
LINYLFGLGDRHYDNIKLTQNGIIFHIDFDFIMGAEPKKLINYRLAPEIKWTSHLAEPLFENLNAADLKTTALFKHVKYLKLIENILKGFEIVKKNSHLFESNIFSLMLNCKIKNLNTISFETFKKRLLIDMIDEDDRKTYLTNKINSNYDTWGGWFIDIYHQNEHKQYVRNMFH